jgi:hypothetical protein
MNSLSTNRRYRVLASLSYFKYFLQWVDWFQIKTEMGQEVPARTGLGSTTVLAVVTIGFGFVGTTKAGGIIEEQGRSRGGANKVLIRMANFISRFFMKKTTIKS